MDTQAAVHILWDYLCLHQTPKEADCIIGFGCYNEDVARRAAQLYRQGLAPLILFTGGLGRNTSSMWTESEASRFARIAIAEGVPESAILVEERSTNSGENLIFSRRMLMDRGLSHPRIIGVQKPYMERRLYAAFPVYWPEAEVTVTSWQQTYEQYLSGLSRWGRTEEDTIHMIVGDFQRISVYADRGFQIPQVIPPEAEEAFNELVRLGYTKQLIQK
ncbi:MAG: YdcF family protein [Faecousia sp.]